MLWKVAMLIWCGVAALTVEALGGPFWLQCFAGFLVGLFWPSEGATTR